MNSQKMHIRLFSGKAFKYGRGYFDSRGIIFFIIRITIFNSWVSSTWISCFLPSPSWASGVTFHASIKQCSYQLIENIRLSRRLQTTFSCTAVSVCTTWSTPSAMTSHMVRRSAASIALCLHDQVALLAEHLQCFVLLPLIHLHL